MAVSATRVTVATTATQIAAPAADDATGSVFHVKNAGTQDVFLGPAGVTTTTGYALAAGATGPPIELGKGESLHGIVAATTAIVHVLAVSGAG